MPPACYTDVVSSLEDRRRTRAAWPVRKFRLGEEPTVDERDSTTVDERVAMVWKLTCEQWALGDREWPDYRRSEMPGKILRNR